MPHHTLAIVFGFLAAQALASPTPTEDRAANENAARQIPKITDVAQLSSALDSFEASFSSVAAGVEVGEAILTNIVPAPGPTAIPELEQELQKITEANPGDIFRNGFEILANGLAGGDYVQIAKSYLVASNTNNVNLIPPSRPIYPKADPADAPYSLSESQLRKAIYIPPGFTYGRVPAVLFLPGTAALAGQNFGPNIGKLLADRKIADPVYVNIPNENLGDIQVAAEYAAYAVNYISGISQNKNVSF